MTSPLKDFSGHASSTSASSGVTNFFPESAPARILTSQELLSLIQEGKLENAAVIGITTSKTG